MKTVEGAPGQFVAGLGESLFRGDFDQAAALLVDVPVGGVIKTWGMILRVDALSAEETILLRKSVDSHKEHGAFVAGGATTVFEGTWSALDDREVLRIAAEHAHIPGDKLFIHTHWDPSGTPIPSGPDIGIFRHLFEQWGYRCRVVSWLPGGRTFEFLGEYMMR